MTKRYFKFTSAKSGLYRHFTKNVTFNFRVSSLYYQNLKGIQLYMFITNALNQAVQIIKGRCFQNFRTYIQISCKHYPTDRSIRTRNTHLLTVGLEERVHWATVTSKFLHTILLSQFVHKRKYTAKKFNPYFGINHRFWLTKRFFFQQNFANTNS